MTRRSLPSDLFNGQREVETAVASAVSIYLATTCSWVGKFRHGSVGIIAHDERSNRSQATEDAAGTISVLKFLRSSTSPRLLPSRPAEIKRYERVPSSFARFTNSVFRSEDE